MVSGQRWGLSSDPFDALSLASKPLLVSDGFRRAYRDLLGAVRNRESLAILSGECGIGKTTLLRYLLQGLAFTGIVVENYPPNRSPTVSAETGKRDERAPAGTPPRALAEAPLDWRGMRERLVQLSREARALVLAIDDADALPEEILRDVLSLSGELTGARGSLTVLLAGSPTVASKVLASSIAADRRITHARLEPLSEAEVRAYVAEALARAGRRDTGRRDTELFLPEAITGLARRSAGHPRQLNEICRAALSLAANRDLDVVTADIVDEAAETCANGSAPPLPLVGSIAASSTDSMNGEQWAAAKNNGTESADNEPVPSPSLSEVPPASPDRQGPGMGAPPVSRPAAISAGPSATKARPASTRTRPRDKTIPRPLVAYATAAAIVVAGALGWQLLRDTPYLALGLDSIRGWASPLFSAWNTLSNAPLPTFSSTPSENAPAQMPADVELPEVGLAGGPAPSTESVRAEPTDVSAARLERPSAETTSSVGAQTGSEASPAPPAPASAHGSAAPPSLPASADVAALIARGDELLRLSDAVAARLLYEYAAAKGSGKAMTAMAGSYDPLVLSKAGVRGVHPDPAQAIAWYQRAIAAGDGEAESRLRTLVEHLRRTGAMTAPQAPAPLDQTE